MLVRPAITSARPFSWRFFMPALRAWARMSAASAPRPIIARASSSSAISSNRPVRPTYRELLHRGQRTGLPFSKATVFGGR